MSVCFSTNYNSVTENVLKQLRKTVIKNQKQFIPTLVFAIVSIDYVNIIFTKLIADILENSDIALTSPTRNRRYDDKSC